MIDHDRLFKELLSTFFLEFVELFLPDVAQYLDPDSLTPLDKEIFTDITAGEKYEADLVMKVRFRGEDAFFLIHIEHQSHTQSNFSKRMFRYFARLYETHDLPVYPVVLFSHNTPKKEEPNNHTVIFPNKKILDFSYDVVQLNRFNWREFVNQSNPVASAFMAKMDIAKEDRPKVKLECLRLLATLKLNPAKMQLISGFVDTYLRLNTNEQKYFNTGLEKLDLEQKEFVMEIVTSWMEEGIEKGLQQGKQQGYLMFAIQQLKHKFGAKVEIYQGQLEALSFEQLDGLAEELLNFTEFSDLEKWITTHS